LKTIGVYLVAKPFIGGSYQYNLSIIKALSSLNEENYKIRAFYHDESWSTILPDHFSKILTKKPSFLYRGLSKLYRLIDRTAKGLRRFDSVFNPMARLINRSDCNLVIFPSQDVMAYTTSIKSITSIHDLMHRYEGHFEEYQNGVIVERDKHYTMICKHSDGILVDSNIGKTHVIESYNIDSNKIFVLPFVPPYYLLNSKEIDICSLFNLPDKFIFYPAQFWEHKNHSILLKAIKVLKDRGVNINLVLVGSKKNNYNKVISEISEYCLEDNVKILGYVSNDEIYSLYKKAIAMTFVSLIGPTNIPPMEAMLCGCPLICSNAYAMPDQTGNAAILFDPLDVSGLATAIERIWTNESLRSELILNGLDKIKEYNQNNFNTNLENLICKLI
jgi:glycosyltransferase involved in cell wall biosynthesis